MQRRYRALAVLGLATMVAGGCSIPNTAPDEIAVHYGGGPTESHRAKGCVPSGTREVNSAGDLYFYYPTGQRTFDFGGDKNADSAPIQVISKDNQILTIKGQVNFELNTTCSVLTKFNDTIGRRYKAYMEQDDTGHYVTGDGWTKMLNLYIGRAVNTSLDQVAKQYTRTELFSDPKVKAQIQTQLNQDLAKLVNQQTQQVAKDEFFINYSALVLQPDPGEEYRRILTEQQQVVAQAQANQAKAVADAEAAKAAADAQVAQKEAEARAARAEAQVQKAQISPFRSVDKYLQNKALEQGLNPYQPTYGQPPVVTTPAPDPSR